MSRRGGSTPAHLAPDHQAPNRPGLRPADWAVLAGCVALGLFVYRGALAAFYSPDDLMLLERAAGLSSAPVQLWRFISGHLYFRLAWPIFHAWPLPWHAINWLLHGLNVALVFVWLRGRGASLAAAALGAGLFASSRLFLGAVYPVTGVGELLGLSFLLGAFLLSDSTRAFAAMPSAAGWRRAVALAGSAALFALAVLSKESVLLLPLLLLLPHPPGSSRQQVLRRALPALGTGVLLAGLLLLTGVRTGSLAGEAYATGFGSNLGHNLMTYHAWILDYTRATPDAAGAPDPHALLAGLPLLLALAALAWGCRREGLAAVGIAWWLLGLLPVLPLLHHSYSYYLYVPSVGLAVAAAAALGWLEQRISVLHASPGWVGALSAVLVLTHAAASSRLISERQGERLAGVDVPADPYFRKSETARRAATDVRAILDTLDLAARGGRAHALMYSPEGGAQVFDATTGRARSTDARPGHRYDLLQEALDGGRALRLFAPALDTVVFTSRWSGEYRDFDLFLYNAEGGVVHLGRGPQAQREALDWLEHFHYDADALEHAGAAVKAWPEEAPLRFHYAVLLGRAGEHDGAVAQLQELLRRNPSDSLAGVAAGLLRRM